MMSKRILFMVLLSCALAQIADTNKEMLLAIEVSRHGARSPYNVDPIYTAGIDWRGAASELTALGE